MVHLLNAPVRRRRASNRLPVRVRAVRPGLLDPRFAGDPWVVDCRDGSATVCLDDYTLTRLSVVTLDLPSLKRIWFEMRFRVRPPCRNQSA